MYRFGISRAVYWSFLGERLNEDGIFYPLNSKRKFLRNGVVKWPGNARLNGDTG